MSKYPQPETQFPHPYNGDDHPAHPSSQILGRCSEGEKKKKLTEEFIVRKSVRVAGNKKRG